MPAVASLFAEIGLDTSKLESGLAGAKAKVDGAGSTFNGLGSVIGGINKTVMVAGAVALPILASAFVDVVHKGMEAQDAQNKLDAAIQSTGKTTGVTVDQVNKLTNSLMTMVPVDDQAIQGSEAILARYDKIGKNVFPQAEMASLDLSQALGISLTAATKKVGLALEDPVKGIAKLHAVGVDLTQQQQDLIKKLEKTGDVAGAQKIEVDALEKSYGGAAKAAGQTLSGKLEILGTQFDNIKENIGQAFIPILSKLVDMFSKYALPILQKFGDWIATQGTPLLQKLADFITGQVVPAVVQMFGWFQKNLLPILIMLAEYIEKNVVPVAEKLAQFVMTKVVPALAQLFLWVAKNVLPIVVELYGVFYANILPVLESVFQTIMTKLVPSLESLWEKLSPILVPALQAVGAILQNVVGPALNVIITIISTLVDWLDTIIGKVEDFFNLLGSLKDKIGSALGGLNNIPIIGGLLPHLASGGIAPGGPTLVGEKGPEIVDLPAGTRVSNADDTKRRMKNGGGNTYNTYVYPAKAQLTEADLVQELKWQELIHG